MNTCPDWVKALNNYRNRLFREIEKRLKEDDHCKSYEGEISIHFPCYFGGPYVLEVRCYVLGPSRSYRYVGETILECVEKANKQLTEWCD